MKKLLSLLLLLLTITVSCQKDDSVINGSGTGGSSSTTGKLTMISTTSDPYFIYIDGNYQCIIKGKNEKSFNLKEGTHTCRYEQQSGYIFYPTDETVTVKIVSGKTTTVRFP